MNEACDIYYRSVRKSFGGTNSVEGIAASVAQRMDFTCTDAEVVQRNKLNQGASNCILISTYVNAQRNTSFSSSTTGTMYKKRISSTQLWLGDRFGEQPMTSNSTVLLNAEIHGLRVQGSYIDHTQGFVWKGKGSFMTNEKFLQLRGFINKFLGDLGLPQNA